MLGIPRTLVCTGPICLADMGGGMRMGYVFRHGSNSCADIAQWPASIENATLENAQDMTEDGPRSMCRE
jgi:hypothetical protein